MASTKWLMNSSYTRIGYTLYWNQRWREESSACHNTPVVGHLGYYKTYKQVREPFSWKGLKNNVLKHVRECFIFQKNKTEHVFPSDFLQPLPIPNQKWESISMDFITGLPKVQGKDCIYVVIDRLTKYAHFHAISSKYKAPKVVDLFFREIFRLHGLSRNIVSDGDNKFINLFWR